MPGATPHPEKGLRPHLKLSVEKVTPDFKPGRKALAESRFGTRVSCPTQALNTKYSSLQRAERMLKTNCLPGPRAGRASASDEGRRSECKHPSRT